MLYYKTVIILLLSALILSCNQPQDRIQVVEDKNLTQKQIDSVLDEYSFQYSRMIFIDSLEKAIIPISTQKARGGKRMSKDSYYADSYPQYWNFIFYDLESGKTKLLTDKKSRISDFRTNLKKVGPVLKSSVLFEIANTDYDLDNKLSYSDPTQLFISDINGENLRRLSPINEDLIEYQIVPNSDKIIFQTQRDSNDDKEFDKKDELIWYLIDLSKDSLPIEVLNETERKNIEKLYFEQWLVKDNKA